LLSAAQLTTQAPFTRRREILRISASGLPVRLLRGGARPTTHQVLGEDMRKRFGIETITCAMVVALIGVATPAFADTFCSGPLASTVVKGKLVVPTGASCSLTSVVVTGDVQVNNGAVALTVTNSYIFGNVDSQNAAVVVTNGSTGRFYATDL